MPPASATPATHSVLLVNGDEIPGVLVSLDDKTLLLDTWYAGKLSIPRNMVKGITSLSGPLVTYEGPASIDGWSIDEFGDDPPRKNWTFQDGALVGSGWGDIRRDVKLPARARIEFDIDLAKGGQGESYFNICIYGDIQKARDDAYMIGIMNNRDNKLIQLMRNSKGRTQAMSDSINWHSPKADSGIMHMDIRVDKETKTIWLFIDGGMLGKWTDKDVFTGKGTSLLFLSVKKTHARISHIKTGAWNGNTDDLLHPQAPPSMEDSVTMKNQDHVSGKLKRIADGKAILTTSYADVTIPLDKIEQIDMSQSGMDQEQRGANDMRGYFAGGGSVTLDLKSWNASGVTATSPDFGKATFSPDAFQRLQFNLGKPDADDAP
jgi:hypothetical protein